jgi:acyl-CoA synthetase (AMP-forming)/AMP-acid ligase II
MTVWRGEGRLDIPDVSLPEFVLADAERRGTKIALVDAASGRSCSYRDLARRAREVAANLSNGGLEPGDVCAIFSLNCIEYPIAFLGAALAGAATTTVHSQHTSEECATQLRDARARILFTSPELLDRALPAARAAGVERLFVFGEGAGAVPFASLEQHADRARIGSSIACDPRIDVVALPYSSGTTGVPKGVMLTHRNLVANLLQLESRAYFGADDTLVCVLPMFHIYGLSVILCQGLYTGATIVTLPRYDLELLMHAVRDHRVSLAHLVPPILLALSKDPSIDPRDLASVHTVFSGAAPLSPSIIRACSERIGCRVEQGYGLTETSPATHSTSRGEDDDAGSAGPCLPATECKLVDTESGVELASTPRDASARGQMELGEPGEILIRGPQVMKGYANRPDATRATIDSDGWLHTGDIGRIDARGRLYVVDRVKELIKYKGCQVAPAELEAILLEHECVADAAVIPVPDEEAGEIPKAFVVTKRGVSADELMSFVAARVAPYKRVRRIEFVSAIPKSPSGKILRRKLVEDERSRSR